MLATLGLMILSFAAGRVMWGNHGLPAIAATLPGDESEFSRELDVRIRELFPMGTSEEKLIDYLRAEGFAPEWRHRNDPNISLFVRSGLICKKAVLVFWRADSAGILTEVNGAYSRRMRVTFA